MKLSNKILITFFGIILAFTLLAFAEIRIKGDTRMLTDKNSIAETVSLIGLNYLVINDRLDQFIHVRASNEPRLEMKSKSGSILSKLKYNFSADTLYINGIEDVDSNFDITVYVPENGFTGIRLASASVQLTDIKQDMLSVIQVDGRIDVGNGVYLEKLVLKASSDARLELVDYSEIDTVSLQLDNSNLSLYSKVSVLEGSIENNSTINSSDIGEIHLKKDQGSRLWISN